MPKTVSPAYRRVVETYTQGLKLEIVDIEYSNGQTDVVVSGSGFLKGYDPATGAERWSSNSTLRTMMSSPSTRQRSAPSST